MRKLLVFIASLFLFFIIIPYFQSHAHAECLINQVQTVDATPKLIESLPQNFKGEVKLITKDKCLPINTTFKVILYPSIMALKDTYSTPLFRNPRRPVESNDVSSSDGQTLKVGLNFNREDRIYSDYEKGFYAAVKPSYIGVWKILVCLPESKSGPIQECDNHPVAQGSISVTQNNLLTPTPTPQTDQPIIYPENQSQCTFQVGLGDIHLIANNSNPDNPYHWWWTEEGGKGTITPEFLPGEETSILNYLRFTIPADKTKDRKTTDKKPNGYLLCVDLKDKKREGANCIKLYFKAYDPKQKGIDTSCTANNAGDITPSPKSPLPPCAQWTYLNGTPIPTPAPNEKGSIYNDPDYKNRKCGAIQTAIGDINTEPQAFVRRIFSLVLGLAGGIALILIIISGYRMMASQGNPEALTAARDQLISAIVGLLFIIFSFVILQVIGVDILKIPGFAK